MMNKVYDKALLGDILEVYMDDMCNTILDVSRKSSMCISLVLDTLKFTTINFQMNNLYNIMRSYNNNTIHLF
jgi:hypothetical protein